MIFNLLLYLLMATELQEVQTPIEQKAPIYSGQSIGRTERPISARTQINNRYLDSVKATKTQSIPTMTSTKITGYTFNNVGNLLFNKNADSVTIPITGTYQIIVNYEFAGATTLDSIYEVMLNSSLLYQTTRIGTNFGETIQIIGVENLNKGDIIELNVVKIDSGNLNINVSLSVIKIS